MLANAIHTVTFIAEGASPVPSQEVEHNGRLVPPNIIVSDTISIPVQWYIDEAHTQEWDAENGRVTADLTLYAAWKGKLGEDGGNTDSEDDDSGASPSSPSSSNAGNNTNANIPHAANEQTIARTGDNTSRMLAALSALVLVSFSAALFARRKIKAATESDSLTSS